MNTSSVIEALSETAQQSVPHRPEFFRPPKHGVDPYFGLGRSFYYEAEARGWFKLVRLRERGKQRGITLIPYDAVAAFIQRERDAT